ncbi:DUF4114 domain-containing protein [Nostoc sp. FACHB-888]|uniref:DUF4114 domain-containing protein n=1 Tax=Nostoc sp. FACHB-888 TaxID=2692842 RepID=UPI001685656A|nr:DUF4114 domain-containing protein [Nostoc sp. FACHB-888]MBD2243465.1 DUF4114 domain-containing protein [Nostoc sp. FACHB-888]
MIINGTSSQDELYASQNDQVFGFEGDDTLDAASNGQGNNLLDGGSGNDLLVGGNNDTLRGGVGVDSLLALGSSGFNTLEGEEDDDELVVVEGSNNKLDGGLGNDELTVLDGSGYNTLLGGIGNDFLDVSNGIGNNRLEGNEGDDFLIGGLASDRLFGGSGDDSLLGGTNGSQLIGGTEKDRFYIASAAVPDVSIEVLDFTKGEDKVLIPGIPEVQKFSDIKLEQVGLDTSIKVNINGELKEFGILRNIQANTLTPDDFDYIVATFSITNASATEGNAITFTINRAEDTQAEQSVTVSTSLTAEDTASSTDFTAQTETITFQAGETQKSFIVETTPDFLFEENETFTVSLSNPTNEAIVNPNSGTAKGTINDDDSNPDSVVTITETGDSTNVTEGGTDDSYSLVLSSQPNADVTIGISNSKQIKTSTQALTFTTLNWNVAQNVTLTAVDDEVIEGEGSEAIGHTATSSDANYDGIAIASVNVGITDNDIPLSKSADSDVFTVKGNGNKARLSVELTGRSSNQYEVGVFTVDNQQGNIGDIAPGATGYAEAAVQRAKVIFSSLGNIPNGFNGNLTSLVQFTSGEQIRFYLVRNSTTDSILARQASITDILFSDPTNLQIDSLSDGSFSLAWKGQNFKVKIQATNQQLPLGASFQGQEEGELINLQGVAQSAKADFKVNREASFNNFVGFYKVTDQNGGIDTNNDGTADILVGQAGYTEAAIRGRVTGIDLTVNNQGSATYTGTFGADSVFAPFMIVDGRPDAILDSNVNNDPKVYFAFLGANSDKVDHIRLLGNNTFGFEDLANGGDKDYNDVIVQVNLSVNAA